MAKACSTADSASRLDPVPSPAKPSDPQNRGLVVGMLRLGAAA
jgi:hypothetical protein